MVKCPRCDAMADETQRATCPVCFTPLNAQAVPPPEPAPTDPPMPPYPQAAPPPFPQGAQPGYAPSEYAPPLPPQTIYAPPPPQPPPPPPPAPRAGARVSLTGEVIYDDEASAPAAPYRESRTETGPAPRPGPIPVTPRSVGPTGPARPTPSPSRAPIVAARRETPSRSGGSGPVVAVAVVLLLAFGGFGGWYYWMHRTNPKDQATKFFVALKSEDWKTMYDFLETDGKEYSSAQDFADKTAAKLNEDPDTANKLKMGLGFVDFKVGEPTITGDEASVPVTMSISMINFNKTDNIKMQNFSGIWKVSKAQTGSLRFDPSSLQSGAGLGGGGGLGAGGLGGEPGGQ